MAFVNLLPPQYSGSGFKEITGSAFGGANYIEVHPRDVIWSLDFTDPSMLTTSAGTIAAAKAYLAARGATLTRASAATVQTSASTVYTGFGVDDPRIGNAGSGQGLVVEEARTNLLINARDTNGAGWAAAGAPVLTDPYGVGPDGSALSIRHNNPSSAYWYTSSAVTIGSKYVGSSWLRGPAGGEAAQICVSATAVDGVVKRRTLTTAWERVATPVRTATAGIEYFLPVDTRNLSGIGGDAAQARDNVVDLCQLEAGAFPTSAIITTGATATRAADVLAADFSHVVRGGVMRMGLRFIPKGANAEYSISGMYVFANAAGTSRAYFSNTGALTVQIGTSITSSNTFTWSAGDVIDLYFELGSGSPYVAIRKNGGARTLFVFSGTHASAAPSSGAMYILNYVGTNPLTAWLQQYFGYTRRPQWAA